MSEAGDRAVNVAIWWEHVRLDRPLTVDEGDAVERAVRADAVERAVRAAACPACGHARGAPRKAS